MCGVKSKFIIYLLSNVFGEANVYRIVSITGDKDVPESPRRQQKA
jgi:hypothetical protein